jgi:hypothetical protein
VPDFINGKSHSWAWVGEISFLSLLDIEDNIDDDDDDG